MNAKPLVLAGILVLGTAALAPWAVGHYVEREIRAGIDRFNRGQNAASVVVDSYHRSWLRSELVTRVTLKDDDADLVRVTTRMKHAPYAGLDFVAGESQVHLPEASAATEQYYFGGQAPVSVAFSVSPGGAVYGAMQSPAVDKPIVKAPKSRIELAASRGSFAMNSDGVYRFEWSMSKIAFTAPQMAIALDGIALSAFGGLAADDFAVPSGFDASVQLYKASTAGHASALSKVSLSSSLTPKGDTIRIALGLRAGPGSLVAAGGTQAWDSFEFRCSLSDIPKAAAAKYSADMNSIFDTGATQAQRTLLAMGALSEFTAALASAEPTFAVDKLELQAPGGNVAATLRLRLDKSRWLSQTAGWGLTNALMLDGKVSVSRALALELAGAGMRDQALAALKAEDREPSPENVKSASRRVAEASLAQLASLGLVKDGETLDFELVARNGAFTVNGVSANRIALR
ncbi:MAG: DUF945 family protein [Burkholderiales bacterium]|nr:DUF945 family protein [Burkholderiales bacterium]